MTAYRIGLLGSVISLALGCTTTIDAVTSGPDGEGGGEMSSSAASGVGGNQMTSGVGVGGTTTNAGVGVGGAGGYMSSASSAVGGAPATTGSGDGGYMTSSSSGMGGVGGDPMTGSVTGVGGSGGFMTSSSSGMGGVGGDPMTTSVSGVGGSGGFMSSSSSGMGGDPLPSTSGSGVGGGPACGTPDPVGQLTYCGGTVTGATGGMNTMCTTFLCDDNGNIWEATCTNDSCTCAYNSQEICSCGLDPAGDTCTGMGCCPMPWVNP